MTRRPGSAADPLWYKDAIIYELHVRGFYDANQDGVGDFPGLIQKLDYLQDLGVTCLWLLPFFPSPLRDDGYDIADYTSVHPAYGTLDDFREFLQAAHSRGLQVMIELVINHTSDQHPWFQAARRAPPGSPERDFYVWSDTKQRYQDARIIFTDTETSNWTWDPEARAYYWHRFFSHQPDLNFDNPRVVQEVIRVMRFWLDLGVDALRLDAIPYLVERDGTSCENLPETHAVIRTIRQALDRDYAHRMILAEANQLPRDVRAYFGDGDECHMAFHFPLMPRLFMALRLEDRHPVTEIMAETPPIPDTCQWGLFLRNHDELTLEMVSDEERAYMYLAYSADPRMRINVGIRRRLAPLLENNRRRIELLNSILFSFPGTPILYYGDEIGMGDNIYLGDRNAVRTPMQWSADRNAGFSRANPSRLYSPVILDPVFGYEAVNVEAQQGEPSSLLNWTRHMIALRKLFQVFGRGSIEFLEPANRKILAYVRRYGGERVLCVANLSRFAQPVELDLSTFAGLTPVEMLGYVEFPRIGRAGYPLTLGPYGFLWFELHGEPETLEARPVPAVGELELPAEPEAVWAALTRGAARAVLEARVLPEYLPRQPWFGNQGRRIRNCRIEEAIPLTPGSGLFLVEVRFDPEALETYVVAVTCAFGAEAEQIRAAQANAILCHFQAGARSGVLYDALVADEPCLALLDLIARREERAGRRGVLRGRPGAGLADAPDRSAMTAVRRAPGGQGKTSVVYGERLALKLFHRFTEGPRPDCEVTRYLTEVRGFAGVPAYAGSLEYGPREGEPATVALLQRAVANQGDGWHWFQDELGRYQERALTLPPPDTLPEPGPSAWMADDRPLPPNLDELLGISDDAAAVLGRRTAELHLALAAPTADPAFAPEPMTAGDLHDLAERIRRNAGASLDRLKEAFPELPDDLVETASTVISLRGRMWSRLDRLQRLTPGCLRIRVHGDYHLGQVLRTGADFVVMDFEGEPARSLSERRARQAALKDVAGMLRSFSYASQVALLNHVARRPADLERLAPWAEVWEQSVSRVFLQAYLQMAGAAPFLPQERDTLRLMLEAFLLDQALHELRYELDHRPAWVRVPLLGLLGLLDREAGRGRGGSGEVPTRGTRAPTDPA